MSDGVLHDQRFDSLRMLQRNAKADGATVVLHVKRVARESERLGEAVHDLSQMIEGVVECLRVRPVTVSEARIIGRYQVIAIGQPCEKPLKHPRRRLNAVEQKKRFRIFRPSLSVEDRQAVDVRCAIQRGIHLWLPSVIMSSDPMENRPAPDLSVRQARSGLETNVPPISSGCSCPVECG